MRAFHCMHYPLPLLSYSFRIRGFSLMVAYPYTQYRFNQWKYKCIKVLHFGLYIYLHMWIMKPRRKDNFHCQICPLNIKLLTRQLVELSNISEHWKKELALLCLQRKIYLQAHLEAYVSTYCLSCLFNQQKWRIISTRKWKQQAVLRQIRCWLGAVASSCLVATMRFPGNQHSLTAYFRAQFKLLRWCWVDLLRLAVSTAYSLHANLI